MLLYRTILSPFFFYCYLAHRDLHSFPTRRSSDLKASSWPPIHHQNGTCRPFAANHGKLYAADGRHVPRSEEHTSELQSHSDLVCRLLLEKKKKNEQESNNLTHITGPAQHGSQVQA